MIRWKSSFGSVLCGFLAWAAPVLADAVSDWNAITSQAVIAAGPVMRPGASIILDYAMVHAAVHDAVQAIEGKYEPYADRDPGRLGLIHRRGRHGARTTCSSTGFPFRPPVPPGSTRRIWPTSPPTIC